MSFYGTSVSVNPGVQTRSRADGEDYGGGPPERGAVNPVRKCASMVDDIGQNVQNDGVSRCFCTLQKKGGIPPFEKAKSPTKPQLAMVLTPWKYTDFC